MDQQKIGAFLRELRAEKKITQEQLAELLGVTNRSVSRWETGSNMPDLSILIELSKLYQVGVDEILDGKRKETDAGGQASETIEKVAEYANEEKLRLKKTLRGLLIVSLIMSVVTIFLNYFEIEGKFASFLLGFSNGVNLGAMVLLFILMSRRGARIRTAKLKLLNKIRNGKVNK